MTEVTTRLAGLLLVGALVIGCSDEAADRDAGGSAAVDDAPAPVAFAPELEVDLDAMTRTDDGIYIEDTRAGTGATAELGDVVTIAYRAWLPDGMLYEERPNEEGFGAAELTLGEATPAGLNEAIAGMRTGGIRRIVLPPEHGYGLVGRPANVPAGATLVYEVRLRAVQRPED